MKCHYVATALVATAFGLSAVAVRAQQPAAHSGELPERLPARLVDDAHAAFGDHHVRAVHAKGVIFQGTFAPSSEAKNLTKAAVFDAEVPVVVRFSDFTGIPDIADTSVGASPRGFAVKFLMPDGSNLDVVTHSINGFPVATAADFSVFLRAIAESGPDAAKPTALDRFLESHPATRTFLANRRVPESYATSAYFGVNAFLFTDAAGAGRHVRYRFAPEAGERYLDEAALAGRSPDFLRDEIAARVAKGPVRFAWYAQIAEPGDKVEDPSTPWPESRKLVKLGVITIDRVGPNTAEADRSLLFLPGSVLPGIEIADPMLTIRNTLYPLSFHERQ